MKVGSSLTNSDMIKKSHNARVKDYKKDRHQSGLMRLLCVNDF